jgi:O-succinylhomoserine sulfhydrylase
MNEEEFGFETEAIRTQLERTQYLEHSVPLYLTSSFVFEDAEDMRASFAEEKDRNIYSRYSNPNTNEFVEKVCKMEGATAGFACFWNGCRIFNDGCVIKFGDHIVSSSSVLGDTPCSLIIFQSGIFKHRILILTSQKRSKVSSHRIRRFFC